MVTRSEKIIFGQYEYFVWFERKSPFELMLSFEYSLQCSEHLQMKRWFLCKCLIALLHILKQNTLICFLIYLAFFYLKEILRKTFHCFPNLRFCVECIYGKWSFLPMGKLSNLHPLVQKDLWCWLNMYKQSLGGKKKETCIFHSKKCQDKCSKGQQLANNITIRLHGWLIFSVAQVKQCSLNKTLGHKDIKFQIDTSSSFVKQTCTLPAFASEI